MWRPWIGLCVGFFLFFLSVPSAHAALSVAAPVTATSTLNGDTLMQGIHIAGPDASTTPVSLVSGYGFLTLATTTGLTFDGASSGSAIYFSGTVADINAALATLTYRRGGRSVPLYDTLQIALVAKGQPLTPATSVAITTTSDLTLTSTSPQSYATDVGLNADIALTFVSRVYAGTGTITIHKTSDDSTVESISVTGSQVTIPTDSYTATVNPGVTLAESTSYYVLMPRGVFNPSSGGTFIGVTDPSWFHFTTADLTPPTISAVATTSVSSTAEQITWTTNEAASTKVAYSADTLYASSTAESDTGTRVLSHAATVSSLLACTQYNFKVVSVDASGNYATSTADAFTTAGCPGSVAPTVSTSTNITVAAAATSTLTDNSRTLTVRTPANFTATSSSVVVQIRSLPASAVLSALGKPNSSLTSASSVVFNVSALVDNSTTLDSFDAPVTIAYHYTDADVSGLDESTLSMYHYHNGAWLSLPGCTVDTAANTITCTTSSFSTFAIFGTPPVVQTATATEPGSILRGYTARNPLPGEVFMPTAPVAVATTSMATSTPTRNSACRADAFVRSLHMGSEGTAVLALQRLLNCEGFTLAGAGAGSPGNETKYFGNCTYAAVVRFQEAHTAQILTPLGLAHGTGYVGPSTRAFLNALSK